jgi:hypothetical protein
MTDSVALYRRHTKRLDEGRFEALVKRLHKRPNVQQSDDGILAQGEDWALVYGQPCTRMAGVLFYANQSVAAAEPVERTLPAERGQRWAESFLQDNELLPGDTEGGELEFTLDARETEAIVYDGRERTRRSVSTDVVSLIRLDGIPVDGPRAKVRVVFKTDDNPVMMHMGLWERLSRHEDRELISRHEVAAAIRDRLASRKHCGSRDASLRDLHLTYWADEFSGGPDLLTPWYFAEIELVDPRYTGREPIQGPRQVLRVPAYR